MYDDTISQVEERLGDGEREEEDAAKRREIREEEEGKRGKGRQHGLKRFREMRWGREKMRKNGERGKENNRNEVE